MTALHQIALTYKGQDQETILKETKLGKTFLLGSDVDRDKFIVYLSDDILNIMSHLYIYQSPNDKPLSFSRWLLKTDRVGQSNIQYPTPPHVQEVINELDHLSIINVEGASEYASGNGHAYFRRSPWVSSDILMTLKYNLNVKERGLIKGSQDYVWTFPPNYIQQLEERVNKHQK